jgi:hypothetical protein
MSKCLLLRQPNKDWVSLGLQPVELLAVGGAGNNGSPKAIGKLRFSRQFRPNGWRKVCRWVEGKDAGSVGPRKREVVNRSPIDSDGTEVTADVPVNSKSNARSGLVLLRK